MFSLKYTHTHTHTHMLYTVRLQPVDGPVEITVTHRNLDRIGSLAIMWTLLLLSSH